MASKLATQLDWQTLLKAEPRLRDLERTALNLHRYGFREWRDWEIVKRTLESLVGWHAQNPEVSSSLAHDVAYRYLLACFEKGRKP